MSLRHHREGRPIVRTRRRSPDFVRKGGPHIKAIKYEPKVCIMCNGEGVVYVINGRVGVCNECGGEGEL